MLPRFKQYLSEQHLVADGHKVLLGVSGGRDSVCMAHLFHRASIPFAIAHCNFHLRGSESDRDEAFVRHLAVAYGVPLHVAQFDTTTYAHTQGVGIEEAARQLRYHYFATLCTAEGYASVAVAHHKGDSVETLLLGLMRATGISGLHGILPRVQMNLPTGSLTVIRPLIGFTRADIEAYIQQQGLSYVDDSTNTDTEPRRNFVRHRVLPLLREAVPSIDHILANNIAHFRQAELVYRHWLDERFALLAEQGLLRRDTENLQLALPLTEQDFPSDVRPTMLFELLHPYGFNGSQTDNLAQSLSTVGAQFQSRTHILRVGRQILTVSSLNSTYPTPPTLHSSVQIAPVSPSEVPALLSRLRTDATFRQSHAVVDGTRVELPLSVRPWQDGDRFHPFGMKGSRLVSDFLKDLKLDPAEKREVQVVTDATGRIIWIPPYRTSQYAAVDPSAPSDTTWVLQIG